MLTFSLNTIKRINEYKDYKKIMNEIKNIHSQSVHRTSIKTNITYIRRIDIVF